jgi:hypothetical protein
MSESFSQIEDEILEANQCACIITFDSTNLSIYIERTAIIPKLDSSPVPEAAIILNLYLSACN